MVEPLKPEYSAAGKLRFSFRFTSTLHNNAAPLRSCGNAGQWEEALRLIDKLEALALGGVCVPMSTTMYNFGIDAVSAYVSCIMPLASEE